MDQLSTLLHDYSIPTHLSCLSQMVPVKSEHIYIFVCYSATCPLILLHSGRRRGDSNVPPAPFPALVSAPAPEGPCRRHRKAVPLGTGSLGVPGSFPSDLECGHTPGQSVAPTWHSLSASQGAGDVPSSVGD